MVRWIFVFRHRTSNLKSTVCCSAALSYTCALSLCHSLLTQALVTKYGKGSDRVIAAVEGVRSVVDKVRVGRV